jgi:glycosyltransferase involved in cell wall biosynthesis
VRPGPVVHLVVPEGVEDPSRPSGGNTYDRRLRLGLTAAGWSVRAEPVAGEWPLAGEAGRRRLGRVLAAVPDGSVVLVDGLVGSAVPEVLVPAARRLRLVVLLHMPVGCDGGHQRTVDRERAALSAAAAVVTTSTWTRTWLLAAYGLEPGRVHVAHPGVDAADPATGTPGGGNLLCVGAVLPGKGHDLLVEALAATADLTWRCSCVGTLTRAPELVAALRRRIHQAGLEERVELTGPRTGRALHATYAEADVLVLASRAETYGMVVTEALARGLPVLATDVGGVPEALGRTPDGRVPGVLVPPDDAAALAGALRRWLSDPALRDGLRDAARSRRAGLTGWSRTADRVARVLAEVAA